MFSRQHCGCRLAGMEAAGRTNAHCIDFRSQKAVQSRKSCRAIFSSKFFSPLHLRVANASQHRTGYPADCFRVPTRNHPASNDSKPQESLHSPSSSLASYLLNCAPIITFLSLQGLNIFSQKVYIFPKRQLFPPDFLPLSTEYRILSLVNVRSTCYNQNKLFPFFRQKEVSK